MPRLRPFLLPAAAFAAVVAGNAVAWRKASAIEQRNHELAARIQFAAHQGSLATGPLSGSGRMLSPVVQFRQQLARWTRDEGSAGVRNLPDMLAILRAISEMEGPDLAAALADRDHLTADEPTRRKLESWLAEALVAKDPALALDSLADRLSEADPALLPHLASAIRRWMRQDPAAAIAWLDRRIDEGVFDSKSLDGRNPARLEFEAAAVEALLVSDVGAARLRVAALAEDQRRETMERIGFPDLPPDGQVAYAQLARELVPSDELAGLVTHLASSILPGSGLDGVDTILDRIDASPDERFFATRQAAYDHLRDIAAEREITAPDIEPLEQWLQQQSPETANRITAEALAEAADTGTSFTVAQACDLISDLHQKTRDDSVIENFLMRLAARSRSDEALHLLDRITDPDRRASIKDRLD